MQEMPETQVQPLGWEDPLEESLAAHSSILAGKVPCTEESGRLQPMGSQRGGTQLLNNNRIRRHSRSQKMLPWNGFKKARSWGPGLHLWPYHCIQRLSVVWLVRTTKVIWIRMSSSYMITESFWECVLWELIFFLLKHWDRIEYIKTGLLLLVS